jgi:hypothetical protein
VRRRRSRRAFAALFGIALVAGMGANGAAVAQTSSTGPSFGGYKIDAAGEGLSFTYNSPGLIPGTPSPLFALSLPESLTNMDSGPSGYALASLVYPGPLVADLPTVLALGGVPNADQIPAYPVRSQAFFPAGPTSANQTVGPGQEVVSTDATTANAQTLFGAAQLPPVTNIGNIVSTSMSQITDTAVVTRTRVEMTNVDLLLGVIHMDSVVTDLVANSDGSTAATDGTTTLTGVTFLGQPATIDGSGVHLAAPPSTTAPAPAPGPSLPLGGVTGPLQPVVDQLDQLLVQTLGTANADVNDLLTSAGITVQLIEPTEVKSGAEASRLASGLLVTLTYNGSTEPVLSSLLNLIPIESLPSQGIGPIPFSSPQSLVLALKATHIETIGLAAGHVHAAAAPPFTFPAISFPSIGTPGAVGSAGSGGSFATPAPALGGASGGGGGGSVGASLPIGFAGGAPLAAVASALILLAAGSFFWFGSGRLADNVLNVASSSCPEGLDRTGPGGTP